MKKIKIALIGITILLSFAIAYLTMSPQDPLNVYDIRVEVDGHTIKSYRESETRIYLFLPSYVNVQSIKLAWNSATFYGPEGKKYKRGSLLKDLPMNEPISCHFVKDDLAFSLTIMQSANIATAYIDTQSGTMEHILADKEVRESGTISCVDANGVEAYNGALKYIKGRGNYSWGNYDKKSFTIAVDKDAKILGLAPGEKYGLVANASDKSLLRNELARQMEKAVELPYAMTGVFLDLYLNGEYVGNYYLCPTIEVGEGRIAIQDLGEEMDRIYDKTEYESFETIETMQHKAKSLPANPVDITGGYLVEREFSDRYQLEQETYLSYFHTDEGEIFIICSPKCCSGEEITYLKDTFDLMEEDILAHGTSDRINEHTFAAKVLVEEFVKNYDAGVSSAYYYKDSDLVDGRICAAPGWDYDMSLGNYLEWMEYDSQSATGLTKLSVSAYASPWFEAFYENEAFCDRMADLYKDKLIPYLDKLLDDGLKNYEKMLFRSAAMDEARWASMYEENGHIEGTSQEYEKLHNFINMRKNYLSNLWEIQ